MSVIANPPFPSYFDSDGSPLEDGYIYFGAANQNPETNPITVYWDSAYTQPALQPIRTSGGFTYRAGTPANIYVSTDFSITVRDKNRRLVYSKLLSEGQATAEVNLQYSTQAITATAAQTVFGLSTAYTPGNNSLAVYHNGSRLIVGQDYTETTSTSITLAIGATAGDVLQFVTATPINPSSLGAAAVAYVPAGAGAVATNVQAKLREVVSVKDFGAVGDGVADDTAAIQSAVDSLPSSGGKIEFPKGIYTISSQITIANKSNICLSGFGFSGSYNSTTYGATINATGSFTAFSFSNGVGCTVENLQIKGAYCAIYFNGCLGFRVLNCNLRENGIGLDVTGNGVGIVQGNLVRNNTIVGLRFLASSGDTVVTENDIGGNPYGIYVASGGMHIHNNMVFYSNNVTGTGAGLIINAQDVNADSTISQCFITNNLFGRNDTAIKIQGDSLASPTVESVIISENRIHQADDGGSGFDPAFAYGYGVEINWAKWINVKNNTFAGMRSFAVSAFQCESGVYVSGNDIRYGSDATPANGHGVVFNDVQWGRVENNNFIGNTGTAVLMKCDLVSAFTQNNMIRGNTFQSNGAIYNEADVRTRANFVADNLGGTLGSYVLNVTTPLTQVRHIVQGGNQETLKNQTFSLDGAAWNGSRFVLGSYNFWVDSSGRLRIKSSAPTSDTDGTVVGTQV
jgi:hypothetical protein